MNLIDNETIEIDGNHLSGFNDDEVLSVSSIDSVFNHIPMEIFTKFSNLKRINFHNSSVNILNDFENCEKLEEIFLNDNKIKKLTNEFDACTNVREILIKNNGVDSVDDGVFKKLTNLKNVNFDTNQIEELSENIFETNPSLDFFAAWDNKITNITKKTF